MAGPRVRETAPSDEGATTRRKWFEGGENVHTAPRESEAEKEALEPRAKDVFVKPWLPPSGKRNVDRWPSLETDGLAVQMRPEDLRMGMVGAGILGVGRGGGVRMQSDEMEMD